MKANRLFKDILSVLSSNVFSIFMGILSGVLIARLLGPEGKGEFTFLSTIPILVLSFGSLGMRRASLFHMASEKHDNQGVLSSLFLLWLLASSIGVGVSLLCFWLEDPAYFEMDILLALVLIIPFQLGISYMGGIFLGYQNYRKANVLRWSRASLFTLMLVVFLIIFQLGLEGAIYAYTLSAFTIFVYGIILLKKQYKFRFTPSTKYVRDMLKLGIQYALTVAVLKLNLRIDIIILEDLVGKADLGYYSLAVSIAEQLWQIPTAVGTVIMAKAASKFARKEMDTKIASVLRISFLTGILGSIALITILPFILPLVYGDRFEPSINIVNMILPGIVLFMIYKILGSKMDGSGRPLVSFAVALPVLLINIIFNYLLIPEHGTMGAVYASNISYSFAAITMLIVYSKINNVSIKDLIVYKKSDFEWIKTIGKKRRKNG